jgi:hypothetical protein
MRRGLAAVLMSIAHLALGFAINGWWFNHTALNPSTTDKIAEHVLANEDVNDQLVRVITANVAPQLTAAGVPITEEQVDDIVRRETHSAGGIALLQNLVTQAHAKVIGQSSAPVTISTQQLVSMFGSAAAGLQPVEIPVPEVKPLSWLQDTLNNTVPMAIMVAIIAAVLSFLVDSDKAASLRGIGIGLILIAGAMMVLGYVVPVLVAPRLTSSPWVEVVPEIAKEQLSLLGGIALLAAGAGLAAFTGAAILNRRR